MATIGASVSDEVKRQFEGVARHRQVTASRLCALLVHDFLKRNDGQVDVPRQGQLLLQPAGGAAVAAWEAAKTKQVFVRMSPFYYDQLEQLANDRNWHRGTYLANLLYAHVDRRPVLCHAEIDALRQVARQLADMGRNINQIAKKLNTSIEHAHLVTSIDFELVKMLLELETNAVKALLSANVHGWGVGDGEA